MLYSQTPVGARSRRSEVTQCTILHRLFKRVIKEASHLSILFLFSIHIHACCCLILFQGLLGFAQCVCIWFFAVCGSRDFYIFMWSSLSLCKLFDT